MCVHYVHPLYGEQCLGACHERLSLMSNISPLSSDEFPERNLKGIHQHFVFRRKPDDLGKLVRHMFADRAGRNSGTSKN
jgi:hypothetical protein